MSTDDPWLEHRQGLLQRRRCPRCAERVPARAILRRAPCPSCGEGLVLRGTETHAEEVLQAIEAGWQQARGPVYGGVLAATFVAGWIPLLSVVVTAAAMLLANVLLVRRPLRWLPPVQRVFARTASRMLLALLAILTLVVNTVAAPLIAAAGLGAILSAITGVAATFVYIEGSLALVRRGVARALDRSSDRGG